MNIMFPSLTSFLSVCAVTIAIFIYSNSIQQPPPPTTTKPSLPQLKMNQTIIEHIVLLKVNPNTEPSSIDSMINGLKGLASLEQVVHLSAGPVHKNHPASSFTFTHLLHCRFKSKQDLSAYATHPAHLAVVKGLILPICDDIMTMDWVASLNDDDGMVLPSEAAMRVSFLKLKEESGKENVFKVIAAGISFGENFSPARAKGFSIASITVFSGGLEVFDETEEIEDLVESVVVVDYVVV